MLCPYCKHDDNKVLDKRETMSSEVTRRRRECLKCKGRFTTYERIETLNITVIKKDGRKEPYMREKLKAGLVKAFEKRPIKLEDIEKIVDLIEAELRKKKKKEIPTRTIGEIVIRKLKKRDDVAYLRFTSVYRSFKDAKSFEKELKTLKRT